VTRAEHRARGLELLAMAETAIGHMQYDRAAAYAALATAHLEAARRYRAPDADTAQP
jgi:hypothetical protein